MAYGERSRRRGGRAIFREISDRNGEGTVLGILGNTFADFGDAQRAIELYRQSLAIGQAISDPRIISACESGLKTLATLPAPALRLPFKFCDPLLATT